MIYADVHEALESSTKSSKRSSFVDPEALPAKRDILNHRDQLMRFLEDLDGDMTVDDLRIALEEYE